jgi:hypothetical protein
VAQRIPKEREAAPSEPVQFELFEDDRYKYRIFVTSLTKKPYQVIEEYDGRAGAETLIGEAKREGLAAIPGKKFQSNYDGLVKSHIPYVVHASTSSARTEYQ